MTAVSSTQYSHTTPSKRTPSKHTPSKQKASKPLTSPLSTTPTLPLCLPTTTFTFHYPTVTPSTSTPSKQQPPQPTLQTLPQELIHLIFLHIHPRTLHPYRRLCTHINTSLLSPSFALLSLKPYFTTIHLQTTRSKKRSVEREVVREYGDEETWDEFDQVWFFWTEGFQDVYARFVLRGVREMVLTRDAVWKLFLRRKVGKGTDGVRLLRIPKAIGLLCSLTKIEFTGSAVDLEDAGCSGPILEGIIPVELGQLRYLATLDLSYNELCGEIPSELSGLDNLTALNLGFNQLTGSIPLELAQLVSLVSLDLSHNTLNGSLPDLSSCINLEHLQLHSNKLTGNSIDSLISSLTRLKTLDIGSNKFSGDLPSNTWPKSLTRIDVSDNDFMGTLSTALYDLLDLKTLYVGGNALKGNIPPDVVHMIAGGMLRSDLLVSNGFKEEEYDVGEFFRSLYME
ncbi:hypothetical protein HDU79_011477 [Rhizoclosmatium sp. JEL0117]|nr:hypothetical protein HDU79_011477 [Rhizoclosmatium sp. JEL0117]